MPTWRWGREVERGGFTWEGRGIRGGNVGEVGGEANSESRAAGESLLGPVLRHVVSLSGSFLPPGD